jgi:hypothetical protein
MEDTPRRELIPRIERRHEVTRRELQALVCAYKLIVSPAVYGLSPPAARSASTEQSKALRRAQGGAAG